MRILLLLLAFTYLACQPAQSPESIVRQWQAHIDKNEFEKAKALSAPRTIELIAWMQTLLTEMNAEDFITQTEFKELTCNEKGDQAVCHYTIVDEGEEFRDSFLLVRIGGKWLIDLPEDEEYDEEGDENWEEIFEEYSQDSLEF